MIDKRKLNGAVDECSVVLHIRKSDAIVHIVSKLHLVEQGLMAGRLAGIRNSDEVKKF